MSHFLSRRISNAPPVGDDQTHEPQKQGCCLILVPKTDIFWSTRTRRRAPRSMLDIVYEADLRLGYGFRQVDGFDYAGGSQ